MPGISLQVNPSQPNPSAQGFYIRGVVDASSVNTNLQKLTYSFSSLTTCNGASYSALDLTSASTMTGGCNSPMLKINPSSLSPGTAYCIQLQVTDPKYPSTKGSAFTVIRAGNPPSFGTCGLSLPLSNSNLTDTDILVFDCYGWTAESTSLPLTYTWEIANMDISPTTFYRLTRPSASSKLTTSLHAGNYSISVTITDVNGISNSALQIIPILISSSNYAQSFSLLMSIDLLEFSNTTLEQQYVAGLQTNLQAIMSDFNQTENYNAALLGISTLSQTVASLSTDYSYNLVADVNAAMETLLSTGIYIDKDTFLLLSDITHMLYSQFKLDDLQRASVSQIMNYCLSNLNFNLQDPRNYLKDSSIDRILSQIEWSQSSQTDAQISQTNWASKYMLALFVLQGRACGETFYEYGGSEYFTCAIGKQDYYSGTIVSQCGFIFNTTKNSNLSTDGCVRMICGKYFNSSRSISISTASNISDVSKSHSEIMFFDSSNNPIIPYQINTILVNLDVPQDFATRHVITSQANMATATFICVWSSFNASLSFWRSNGCTLSAINSSVATCQCTFSNSQGGATVYSVAAINSTNSADSSEPMNLSSTFTTIIAVVLSLVALAVGIVLLFHYKGKEIRSWAKKIWIKIKKRIRKRRKNGVKKDDESRGEEEGDDDNDNESNKGEDGGELKKKSIFASQESLESRSIPPSASSRRKGEIRLSNSFEELSEAENIATQELLKQVKEKDGRREEKSEVGDAGMKGLLSRIGGMLLTSTATTTRTAETAAGVVTKRSSFNARDHESETKWDALEKEDNQGHRLAIPRTINAVSSSTTGAAPKRKIVSQMDDFEVYTLPSVVKKASGGGGGNKQSGAATVSKKPTKQIWPIPM